jgi:hypothetical protein
MSSVYIGVKERLTTYLDKENSPCREYDPYIPANHARFVNCSKTEIWNRIQAKVKCSLEGLGEFIPDNAGISACKDKGQAFVVQKILFDEVKHFTNLFFMVTVPKI